VAEKAEAFEARVAELKSLHASDKVQQMAQLEGRASASEQEL
jgi:hypothetical protein